MGFLTLYFFPFSGETDAKLMTMQRLFSTRTPPLLATGIELLANTDCVSPYLAMSPRSQNSAEKPSRP